MSKSPQKPGSGRLLTIGDASAWATEWTGREVTPSNISYLVNYGRIRKEGDGGPTLVSIDELKRYYASWRGRRETDFKRRLETTKKFDANYPKTEKSGKMPDMKDRRVIIGDSELRLGDCQAALADIPADSVDLIVTSPPYAERRRQTYGGIPAREYVAWFLPRAAEFLRVLKPDGTFILNIKEHAENCERSTYVLELIIALRQQGWLWTEEFVWHKKNSYPGKWPNRFRDGWERLLQFNKNRAFKMYQDAVSVPVGKWAEKRLNALGENDTRRTVPATGSGMGRNISRWVDRERVLPNNVLHMAGECGNKKHSAVFPQSLPAWFIRLFTQKGDLVLDPFMGSGTTVVAASDLGRCAIGVDILSENIAVAHARLAKSRPSSKPRAQRAKKPRRVKSETLSLNRQSAFKGRKAA